MTLAAPPDPQATVLQVIKKVGHIATLPEVTSRIIGLVEDPKSSAGELHRIVAHDPALVTRILKVVNSAFYGLPGQIASVERAIVLLGLNAVKNIAIAASLGQLFRGVKLCEGFTAKDLWTHCIGVGVVARELARQMRLPLADEAFLAGMIHDVGLLVSLQVFPDRLPDVCQKAKEGPASFCEVEDQLISMDHQQLGATLCEQWKFPRSCQLVAGFHHRPTALALNNRLLVTLIYVADTICCTENHGFNLTALNQKLEDADLGAIGLEPGVVQAVRTNAAALIDGASSIIA
ncbi:MAG: HDOD domain-containing protein [Bacillota bacterium]